MTTTANRISTNGAASTKDLSKFTSVGELLAAIAAGEVSPEQASVRLAELAKPAKKRKDKVHSAVTRAHFREHAGPIAIEIGGVAMIADAKEFSTGSLGWFANGKIALKVGDTPVQVQVGVNLTIVGSKELPKE